MPEDAYIVVITVLLPVTAGMLVSQTNPYHALVIRGILGAVAALVYALFGAADVALTEALVGTMLSITLYAVAVRSSLTMRVGVLEQASETFSDTLAHPDLSEELLSAMRQILMKHHMRLELIPYPTPQTLQEALAAKDIHATCVLTEQISPEELSQLPTPRPPYALKTRVRRLYDLMQAHLPLTLTGLTYAPSAGLAQAEVSHASSGTPNSVEVQP